MLRVLPSDIVRLIDSYFPWAASTSDQGQAMWNQLPQIKGVLELIENLPEALVQLGPSDLAKFIFAKSTLRAIANLLEAGNTSAAGGVNWPRVGNLNALSMIRLLLSKCPDEAILSTVASLLFIKDEALRRTIEIDISSAEVSFLNCEWKSATVVAGAALEALLLWAVSDCDESSRTSAIKNLKLENLDPKHPENPPWSLSVYIKVSEHLKKISSDTATQARLAQNFRNLIHPGRQKRLETICDRGAARSALAAVDLARRDLLN